jgi:hypothetical protein
MLREIQLYAKFINYSCYRGRFIIYAISILREGKKMHPEKIKSIERWPTKNNVSEVR